MRVRRGRRIDRATARTPTFPHKKFASFRNVRIWNNLARRNLLPTNGWRHLRCLLNIWSVIGDSGTPRMLTAYEYGDNNRRRDLKVVSVHYILARQSRMLFIRIFYLMGRLNNLILPSSVRHWSLYSLFPV